jgi:hypothetical protein
LSDIPDFKTRQNVAELMAVAPGLAVKDLYRLLVDFKGKLPAARRQAIRKSQVPLPRTIKPERVQSPTLSRNIINLAEDSDDDEVMVKIDPNAPFLEYDTDTPPPEPTRTRRPSATKSFPANSFPTKSNSGRKRTEAPRRRRNRENSIVRDFLAPNDEVEYATDKSSSDEGERYHIRHGQRDENMVEPEELEDLRIDMRRKYAFNAAVLGRRKR